MLVSKRALYNICFNTIKESVASKYDLVYESFEDKTEKAPEGFYDKTQVSKSSSSPRTIGSMSDRPVKVSDERKAWIDDNLEWLSAVPSEMDGVERPFGDLETFEEKVYLVLKKADIISDKVTKQSAEKYAQEAEEARKRREAMQLSQAQSIIDSGNYPEHTMNINDYRSQAVDSTYPIIDDMSDEDTEDLKDIGASSEEANYDDESTFRLPPRRSRYSMSQEPTQKLREVLNQKIRIRF